MQIRLLGKTLATGLWAVQLILASGCAGSFGGPAEAVKQSDACHVHKVAFDIGSSSTKAKAALFDRCQGKVLKFLADTTVRIDFKENLKVSTEKKLSPDFIKQAALQIRKVKEEMEVSESKASKQYHAVATASLREVANAEEFVSEVKSIAGLDVRVIDQQEEAKLGLVAIEGKTGEAQDQIAVWDIGGGSQQITYKHGKHLQFSFAQFGSIGFKNKVISVVKKQDPLTVESPNPLKASQLKQAVAAAEDMSRDQFSGGKSFIKSVKKVYGVGGVWGQSLSTQVGSEIISIGDLEKALQRQAGKTDLQIGGDFADTDVTNIAMVLGEMRILQVTKVHVIKVNLTDGLIFQNSKD